jgi:hypothetical protein
MNFLKKNWMIASCTLIIVLCFCLIYQKISIFSYPKGIASFFLMLGIVFGNNWILFKINKKFGEKYNRRLDRFFVRIAVLVVIFTSIGLFQKMHIKNAKEEMQSIIQNRIYGQMVEKRNYNLVVYGELASLLRMMNDTDYVRAEKEEEYLYGVDKIYDMINPANLSDKQLIDDNKRILDTLFQRTEKYKAWLHSEMPLIEEKIKKLEYRDSLLQGLVKPLIFSLSMNDELVDAYNNLIISIKKIIEFVEIHQKTMSLVDGNIEWGNQTIREKFAQLFKSMIDNNFKINAIDEKQTEYQQQLLEKINN